MRPELWRQSEKLFHAALEQSPEDRRAFLDSACGQDTDLRRHVELLVSAEENAGSFLDKAGVADPTAALRAAGSLVGQQFGHYRIVSPLGVGGMGDVYRAHDTKLSRDVALKTLPYEFARDRERVARFRREARTLASLNHPHIASIYGLEEFNGTDFLVLELVEGKHPSGPLPIAEVLRISAQIADALAAAHARGIIHRDLKPANVMVTPEGSVKVLDFGLAKAIYGEEEREPTPPRTVVDSVAGHVIGTPAYMSPEQARGERVDQRTDVWSFGCLLHELLTGERVFRGSTLQETINAVLECEPEWRMLPSKTPRKVRELLSQCLEKDPARRLNHIADARGIIEGAVRGRNRWRAAAIAVAITGASAAGALWLRPPSRPLDRSAWVQLTDLTDSAVEPALSPDGKMLAFIRGPAAFVSAGQVYVKTLPSGTPVRQLTHDDLDKMSPVFSPDGTSIAYTVRDAAFNWDTWVVPVNGGEPRSWLRNASGLVWTAPHQVLFSQIREGLHMGIVSAEDTRAGSRDVYLPDNERGMAHRSYPSPDGRSALIVEMDKDGLWGPCRVVPLNGSTQGRQVGPPGADCTSGAWSPDGKWVYVTSKAGGSHHIWRQRFPDGTPEQLTSGPTEEEGIAMAPDGRSFVTAVGLQRGSVWIHDAGGNRQISLEGNAFYARFTPDGKKLCYLTMKSVPRPGTNRDPGEVWIADLASGGSERLIAGFQAFSYDISPNGKDIVMEILDKDGKPRLWLAPLDRSSAPRQIPNVEGRECLFGSSGDIFFRRTEGASGFIYRVHPDGTGLRKALERPVLILFGISPDERWILAWAALENNKGSSNQAIPLDGSQALNLGTIGWFWAQGGRSMSIGAGTWGYIVDLPPGQVLPPIRKVGRLTEQDVAALPGARRVEERFVEPGPSPDVYCFYRGGVHRNLYRVPVP